MRKTFLGYLAIALVSTGVAAAVKLHGARSTELLRTEFVQKSAAEAAEGSRAVDQAFGLIYQNLRTLASIPGVRSISRHAETLTPEARTTLQMIYNNLADSVSVSEVYIVPADFDPGRTDPVTGRPEAPIIMFDELILNAGAGLSRDLRASRPDKVRESDASGPPEVEDFEYRQLAEQARWFSANYPDNGQITGLRVPVLSSPEVITCDNSTFIATRDDADRKGVIFSVPYFAPDGRFAGMVSAIILSRALTGLLPSPDFVLTNPANGYVNARPDAGPHVGAAIAADGASSAGRGLIFSQILPLSTEEPRAPWALWVGHDDSQFYGSPEFRALGNLSLAGYGLALVILIAGSLTWHFMTRDLRNSREAAARLALARDEARAAEAAAAALANRVQAVNEDIGRLNRDLSAKIRELEEAQEEIIRRGRMAQLGQLTATIAHEIRNPLGTVRTTAFLLKRKLVGSGLDVSSQLARIDSGIRRCDDIITQLLDFARSKEPEFELTDLDGWLGKAATEAAAEWSGQIDLRIAPGLNGGTVRFDPGRMERAVANLVANAAEAMVGKPGAPAAAVPLNPTITVSTRLSKRGVEITVADNGPGMSAEVMAKIREPLFTTKNFGTGLGLPAVERILELHGGGLEVWSEPGRGAVFTMWLPAERPAVRAA